LAFRHRIQIAQRAPPHRHRMSAPTKCATQWASVFVFPEHFGDDRLSSSTGYGENGFLDLC
jgi:hypothetical protein